MLRATAGCWGRVGRQEGGAGRSVGQEGGWDGKVSGVGRKVGGGTGR